MLSKITVIVQIISKFIVLIGSNARHAILGVTVTMILLLGILSLFGLGSIKFKLTLGFIITILCVIYFVTSESGRNKLSTGLREILKRNKD